MIHRRRIVVISIVIIIITILIAIQDHNIRLYSVLCFVLYACANTTRRNEDTFSAGCIVL